MAPDLLIIGDRGDRLRLRRRIEGLGYRALGASPGEIEQALDRAPAAILLWAHEGEIRPLLARLRSHAAGEGIPIVLCGELGGEIRDLADVLELGADRFLVAPIDEDELRRTLLDLLGPATAIRTDDDATQLTELEVADEATDLFGPRTRDPLLDQLRRTLADLDERPEDDDGGGARGRGEGDGIDLTVMGLGAVPRLDEGAAELGDLSLLAAPARPRASAGARPAATLRIAADAGPSPAAPTIGDAEASTAIVARRRSLDASARSAESTSGDLGERPLVDLLGGLHRVRASGRLHLEGASVADLWLVAGAPAYAEGDDPGDRLSAGLHRRGLLTADEAAALHQRLPADTLADGERLPSGSPLKPHEVPAALVEHLEDLLLRWAARPGGRWSWHADEASPYMSFVTCSIEHVILEAARLELVGAGEPAALRPRARRPLRRPGATEATLAALAPTPAIAGWFSALDGRRTIDEVVADEPRERLAWLRALVALGHVVLLDADADPDASAAIDRRRITARLDAARRGDHLALLGVDADADPGAIARAHRALRRTFSEARLEATTRTAMADALRELALALDRARDVLLDGRRRAAYLAGREDS